MVPPTRMPRAATSGRPVLRLSTVLRGLPGHIRQNDPVIDADFTLTLIGKVLNVFG
jgi:hypothetical protein